MSSDEILNNFFSGSGFENTFTIAEFSKLFDEVHSHAASSLHSALSEQSSMNRSKITDNIESEKSKSVTRSSTLVDIQSPGSSKIPLGGLNDQLLSATEELRAQTSLAQAKIHKKLSVLTIEIEKGQAISARTAGPVNLRSSKETISKCVDLIKAD